ncbi:MAG TPA: 50S ribosomal protein L11 methyltransferase [Nitrospiria bacterium]
MNAQEVIVQTKDWSFHGHTIHLELWPGRVFVPTTTSELIADQISVRPGETVIDLGCGSGFFAVLAAKMGAKRVFALDLHKEACDLTRRNAALNGVADRVDCRQGDLFSSLNGLAADMIINDVSGVADALARCSGWFPDPVPTGGPDGAEPTVRMFQSVRNHLAPKGRLIFPVISLANEQRILDASHRAFTDIRLVCEKRLPLPPSINPEIAPLQKMVSDGIVRLIKKGSRWLWMLRIYEARNAG